MNAPLTADQAIELLRKQPDAYNTPQTLRGLAAQVDADSPGNLTLLYSGSVTDQISSSNIIDAMREAGEDVRIINTSQAAEFLTSRDFYNAVAKAHGIPDPQSIILGSYRGPATDWLYNAKEGPWADASARFADAARGQVRAIASDANPGRVFGATELLHIIANPNVTMMEGIPRETLVSQQARYGSQKTFEMVVARAYDNVGTLNIAVNYAGTPLRSETGQFLLDSRAYFAGTAITGATPPFTSATRPLADSMPVPNAFVEAGNAHLREGLLSITEDAGRGPPSAVVSGLGVLGAATLAVDATATASRVSDLREQGNAVGAQSEIMHFGGRNLGAWGGAVLGTEVLGTAGAESGPLDVVVAGVGAIGGAIGGEKLADAYDQHRICNQTDPQGATWHFDPARPQQGWTRQVPTGEIGYASNHPVVGYSVMPEPLMRTITADPALADRLTFQANKTAVDLALEHPARPRDPWTQPATPDDTSSRIDAPWRRDARTGQWSRAVTHRILEHGLTDTNSEPASAARAARLDAAAQQTMKDNLAGSRHGIAERYQAMYEQRDWAKYGAMPEAVTSALHTPAHTLEASDGHVYTHGADGQWKTPGMLWGSNEAEGNVRRELDATERVERIAGARDHVSGPQQGLHRFSDPGHPQQALYQKLKEVFPPGTSDERLHQATAACCVAGIRQPQQLHGVAGNDHAIHFHSNQLGVPPAQMDMSQAAPSVAQSVHQVQQHDRQQLQLMSQLHAQNAQLQTQGQQGPMQGGR